MKKLSLIMAMVLVATIGGVYATWTYSEVNSAASHTHFSTQMASHTSVEHGTIDVENPVQFEIDQNGVGDHTTKLVIKNGTITGTFVTNSDFEGTVNTSGTEQAGQLTLYAFLTYNGMYEDSASTAIAGVKYNGTALFTTYNTDPFIIKLTETAPGSGQYTFTIAQSVLESKIVLAAIDLDTYAKFTEYSNTVTSSITGKLGITIADTNDSSKIVATP